MRFLRLTAAPLLLLTILAGCASDRPLDKAKRLLAEDRPADAVRVLDRIVGTLKEPTEAAEAWMLTGDALVRLERVSEAFSAYDKAIAVDPKNSEAQLKAAELLIATGNADKVLPLVELAFTRNPNDPRMLSVRGAGLVAAGNFTEAEKTYQNLLRSRPADAQSATAYAELLLRQQRTDEARAVLRRVGETAKSPVAWMALGRLEEQEANPEAAEFAYRSAVACADSAQTNYRLAQFLQRTAKIAEAESVLRHVDELNAKAVTAGDFALTSGRAGTALDSYARRLKEFVSGRDQQTSEQQVRVVSRMVEAALQPAAQATVEARAARAGVLLEQHRAQLDAGTTELLQSEIALVAGDLPQAEAHSARALELQPNSAPAHYLRGILLDRAEEHTRAVSEWEAAVAIDGHAPSRLLLANVALHKGDLNAAEEHAAAVLRDEPANLAALFTYANVLEQQGRLDAAEAITQRALAVAPASPEALVLSGKIAMKRGAMGTALLEFEKALIFDSRSSSGVDGLLSVFAQRKPTRASIAKIEKMAAAAPPSATMFEIAGRLYQMAGLKIDAERALAKSLELDGGRATAALALWQMDKLSVPNLRSGSGASLLQASAAEISGATDVAVSDYESAIARGDNTGVAANNLAFAYAARGQKLNRALELAAEAVRRLPHKAEPVDTLGFVLLKMRQYSAASQAFERALALKPDAAASRQISIHLAEAYEASGLTDKAAEIRGRLSKSKS